ncbi:MAG: DUF6440 family protein [Oscillospiraceae bacterium]|nr:DUF6440 family protein [Oscillospiraceae bacterium]
MSKHKRFQVILDESTGLMGNETEIIVDKATGVNYLFVKNGYGAGLTVLVDAEGKPVITRTN